jgi:hypothetical protein
MSDLADRERLARDVIAFAETLSGRTTLRASGLRAADGVLLMSVVAER